MLAPLLTPYAGCVNTMAKSRKEHGRRAKKDRGELLTVFTAWGDPSLEMVLIVHGFPSRNAALQFEWAWQNPDKSRHFSRNSTNTAPYLAKSGFKRNMFPAKLAVLAEMLHFAAYCRWPLQMHFFAQDVLKNFMENKEIRAPPVNIVIRSGKAQEMPYSFADGMKAEEALQKAEYVRWIKFTADLAKCILCDKKIDFDASIPPAHVSYVTCPRNDCQMISHLYCLADLFLSEFLFPLNSNLPAPPIVPHILPVCGACPSCRANLIWGDLIRATHARRDGITKGPSLLEEKNYEKRRKKKVIDKVRVEQDGVDQETTVNGEVIEIYGKRKAKRNRNEKAKQTNFMGVDVETAEIQKERKTKRKEKKKINETNFSDTETVPSLLPKEFEKETRPHQPLWSVEANLSTGSLSDDSRPAWMKNANNSLLVGQKKERKVKYVELLSSGGE
ncbi:hypothetical protein BC937DRAFT_89146 [Endogone sp. FLAS-F59071]|nr:hypothetical protein BC937DRAFT_89146 [Endogone sp. FLAS-F59071]|eukprot:RUS18099.1 hypothetical protein BC937DRAFT_89146 [Endogone sp. FLAS-F59071]